MQQQKDDGASDVIAFIMILFLIVAAAACWMLIIIPSQGYEAESAHNEKVLLEFADMKKGIDQLWLNSLDGYSNTHLVSLAPSERTSLSTLMYLAPTLGSGMIKIENGTSINMTDTYRYRWIDKNGHTQWSNTSWNSYNTTLLRISYYSNNQYAPNFVIIFEGGAVFYADASGKPYLMVNPYADIQEARRFILLAADPSVRETTILGNLPVTVGYQFIKHYLNSASDWRLVSSVLVHENRDYIELYDRPEIKPASNTQMDASLANFWEDTFRGAAVYNETQFLLNDAGSEVQIMYYGTTVSGGV